MIDMFCLSIYDKIMKITLGKLNGIYYGKVLKKTNVLVDIVQKNASSYTHKFKRLS